jgi:hypothetical protein
MECVRCNSYAYMSAAPSDVTRPQTFRRALALFRIRLAPVRVELLEIHRHISAAFTTAQRLCGAEQKANLAVQVAVYDVPDPQTVLLRFRLGKPGQSQRKECFRASKPLTTKRIRDLECTVR